MRSRLCISRNFLTVSAVLKYVWNRVKPACSPAAGHRKPRKLLPSHLHGITAISLKQPPPFHLSFSPGFAMSISCHLSQLDLLECNLNTPCSITPCRRGIPRRMSKFVALLEICQSHALFSSVIVDRDFQSRTRIFSRTIAWKVFRCLSTRLINGTLDRTRDHESYGK